MADIAEDRLLALYQELRREKKKQTQIRLAAAAILLVVAAFYASQIYGKYQRFDEARFADHARAQLAELAPAAQQELQRALERNQAKVVEGVEAAISSKRDVAEQVLNEELTALSFGVSSRVRAMIVAAIEDSVRANMKVLAEKYPALADEGVQSHLSAELLATVENAATRVTLEEIDGISTTIQGIRDVLSRNDIQSEMERYRNEPDSSQKLLQSFLSLISDRMILACEMPKTGRNAGDAP